METRHDVLIVEADPVAAETFVEQVKQWGYDVTSVGDGRAAIDHIERVEGSIAVILIDMSLTEPTGLELLRTLSRQAPQVVPIATADYGTIESAVQAVRAGAMEYLTKPLVDEELRLTIEKAVQHHALRTENAALRGHTSGGSDSLDGIIAADPRMLRIFEIVESVAASRTTVLMCGESGTGKSLIARAIHQRSPRGGRPFVDLACGSIPETLLESELFGHVRGAFTGAHADKAGRFLAAHEGTIFLDEINSASPALQLKLLRVLQERTFEPVGSNETHEVDVRVILASNQPLEGLVERGEFRQDLYYRINVVSITLPPLRERVADIPLLVDQFISQYSADAGRQITGITDEAMDRLRRYHFPGNIRELENIIERAAVLGRSPKIGIDDLPDHVREPQPNGGSAGITRLADHQPWRIEDLAAMPLRKALEGPERQIILAALEANDWNRQKTAEQLDINRTTLYKKIKQYGLESFGRAG